ncbi:MAG TPA: DUF5694 domain-containing protein [Thermoanaerobaculia bacterium]
MRRLTPFALLLLLLLARPLAGLDGAGGEIPGLDLARPKPKVLVLGVFHFDNPNLDYVKTAGQDMLSPDRQREVRDLVGRLAKFRPTKIALEAAYGTSDLQKKYALYREGKHTLAADEREQLGFRLAAEQGHPAVYPVDYKKDMDIDRVFKVAANGQSELAERLQKVFGYIGPLVENLKQRSVLEQIRFHNGREMETLSRAYLLMAEVGKGADYAGADEVAGWYERNLKIAVNVLRVVESPQDRILVIFGSGHRPLLCHFLRESPDVELVDAAEYLEGN